MKKPDRVFLQMWGPTRDFLIANHEFYVAEAKRRLLDQFDNEEMKIDADRHASECLAERAKNFNPDRDDPADNYEQAYQEGITFYQGLSGLRDSTRLSIIAGMFHEWEKQLRDWLGKEFGQHGFGKNSHAAVWSVNLDQIFDLLQCCSWDVRTLAFYDQLNRCRLVTNVYKHGGGPSFESLRTVAPELTGQDNELPAFFVSALDYSSLTVSDDDLTCFAEAITSFWRELPENIYFSQVSEVPKWFDKALGKDKAEKARRA